MNVTRIASYHDINLLTVKSYRSSYCTVWRLDQSARHSLLCHNSSNATLQNNEIGREWQIPILCRIPNTIGIPCPLRVMMIASVYRRYPPRMGKGVCTNICVNISTMFVSNSSTDLFILLCYKNIWNTTFDLWVFNNLFNQRCRYILNSQAFVILRWGTGAEQPKRVSFFHNRCASVRVNTGTHHAPDFNSRSWAAGRLPLLKIWYLWHD